MKFVTETYLSGPRMLNKIKSLVEQLTHTHTNCSPSPVLSPMIDSKEKKIQFC